MGYVERQALIERLENERESRLLAYFLGDRRSFPGGIPGFSTNLASEQQLTIVEHIKSIGRVPKIDLFLYTRGGSTDSVWPLINNLRAYCDHLSVIVPFRAHSGGTLICLGADEIVMGEFAELSPIDPTTGNQFNPQDPAGQGKRYGISVEDVTAFFALAEERAEVKSAEQKIEMLKELTKEVHPLALGNVQRVYMMIRRLARGLIELHPDEGIGPKMIEEIIEDLTVGFFSHTHAISRREAIKLLGENWVKVPDDQEDELINSLFDEYVKALEMDTNFNLAEFMGNEQSKESTTPSAFIESTGKSHKYLTKHKFIQLPKFPPNVQLQAPPGNALPLPEWAGREYSWVVIKQGWEANEENL